MLVKLLSSVHQSKVSLCQAHMCLSNICDQCLVMLIPHTDCVGVNPERNNKRVEHIKHIHAFPEKLKLIQVSYILGLNVHIFVGELAVRVLGAKMPCRAKELWDGSCGSQVMPIIVA